MADQKSMNEQVNDLFADLIKQNSAQPEPAPVSTEPTSAPAPVPTPPAVTPTPSPSNVTPATVEPSAPAAEPTIPPVSTDIDGPADNWDVDAPAVTPAVTPAPAAVPTLTVTPDFSNLAKVLGKETIKSSDELVSAVNEIKAKADLVSQLPEQLQKAIEIANLNGNYLEYLGVSVIDWGKEDPVTLYENYVINQFTDSQGQVDYERVDKLLEKIDDDEKELRGRDLQRQYMTYQAQEKQRAEQQARITRQNFEQDVKRTVDNLSDVAGFKLSPTHKAELYSYIISGEDQKNKDVSQRVMNAFVTKYFSKIDSFRKTQIRNATKKEILEQATIPQLNTPADGVTPVEPAKPYGLSDYLKELEQKKR